MVIFNSYVSLPEGMAIPPMGTIALASQFQGGFLHPPHHLSWETRRHRPCRRLHQSRDDGLLDEGRAWQPGFLGRPAGNSQFDPARKRFGILVSTKNR